MQIKSIILYNAAGETRILPFQLGKVNIITGRSRTGKTAIIDIVDYCLGRPEFRVFEGVNRDTVAWYAVIFQMGENQILIAKPAPSGTQVRQTQVYYEVGVDISPPPVSKLVPNSNDDAVVQELSERIGISPNLNIPETDQSRDPLEANIRHTTYYLFQKQTIIARRRYSTANKSHSCHRRSKIRFLISSVLFGKTT